MLLKIANIRKRFFFHQKLSSKHNQILIANSKKMFNKQTKSMAEIRQIPQKQLKNNINNLRIILFIRPFFPELF
jgi:hypothetical protein